MNITELKNNHIEVLKMIGFTKITPFRAYKDAGSIEVFLLENPASGLLEFSYKIKGRQSYNAVELVELVSDINQTLVSIKHFERLLELAGDE